MSGWKNLALAIALAAGTTVVLADAAMAQGFTNYGFSPGRGSGYGAYYSGPFRTDSAPLTGGGY